MDQQDQQEDAQCDPKHDQAGSQLIHPGRIDQHDHGQGQHQDAAGQFQDAPVFFLQPAGFQG